jgi:hypothetical protein
MRTVIQNQTEEIIKDLPVREVLCESYDEDLSVSAAVLF